MIPSIGRMVHYVLNDGPTRGQHRPAVIVKVWEPVPSERSAVQLQVFTDGENDEKQSVVWRTSVLQDTENKMPGTWHEAERV